MGPDQELDPAAPEVVLEALVHDQRSPLRAVSNYIALGDGSETLDRIAVAVDLAHDQLDGAAEYLELLRASEGGESAVIDVAEVCRVAAGGAVAVSVTGPGGLTVPASAGRALEVVIADAVATGAERVSAVVDDAEEGWAIRLTVSGRGVLGSGAPRGLAPFRWSDGTRTDGPLGPVGAWMLVRRWGGRLELDADPGVSVTWTLAAGR